MSKYEEVMAKAHEMSCTHRHLRADECPICRKRYEDIAKELQAQEDAKTAIDKIGTEADPTWVEICRILADMEEK